MKILTLHLRIMTNPADKLRTMITLNDPEICEFIKKTSLGVLENTPQFCLLEHAARIENLTATLYLVKKGIKNTRAVEIAIKYNNYDLVRILVDNGVYVNRHTLELAKGKEKIFKFLLHKIEINEALSESFKKSEWYKP